MTAGMDGRRYWWVALDVYFASNPLGARLRKDLGNEGLVVWAALLAAAKRSPNQGIVTFSSDTDLWNLLGVEPPGFTVDAFLTVTGRMKETRKRRRGDVTDVVLTHWEDLQQTSRRQHEAEQKAKSRAETTRTKHSLTRPDHDHDLDPDLDSGRGKRIAIEEATRDKANGANVGNVEKVGAWRFNEDPAKYNAIAGHREAHRFCVRCDDEGMVSEYSPGAGQVIYQCHAVISEAAG